MYSRIIKYISLFLFVSKHLHIINQESPEIRIHNENGFILAILSIKIDRAPEGYEQIDFS